MKLWRKKPDSQRPQSLAFAPPRRGLGVERLLQVNLAVLVPLGAMLLGMREHGMTLAAIVLIAAISSSYLTDQWGWIRLNRVVANSAALGATALALSHFFRVGEEQLVAIANLLIYLQIIMLFQQKTVRVYWQLLVLSVLEVVVATAIVSSLLFGVLLVVYLFVALAALGLIFILRESELHLSHAAARSKTTLATRARRAANSRWPLRREIDVLPSSEPDLPRQILGSGILWRTAGIGVGTLIVATVCFFFLPRFGRALADATGQQALVGYNPNMKLGDLGPLLQNTEIVMHVELFDTAGNFVEPLAPPLLRGSVLNYYRRGEWKLLGAAGNQQGQVPRPPADQPLIRERITIQPMRDRVLFGVYPAYRSEASKTRRYVRYDSQRQHLYRSPPDLVSQSLEYEVLTTGLAGGRQARIVPKMRADEQDMNFLLQLPDEPPSPSDLLQAPASRPTDQDRLIGLRELAASKVRESKLPADDHYGIAKLLERLLSGPPFEYTLDRGPSDPSLDPIEDFITRNPRGHCEYFASALALMLRSQKIPARVVIGYHGGDWVPSDSCYDVRQLHAHAWVEAYLGPHQLKKVPAPELPPRLPPGDGAWLVLDPTPVVDIGDTFAQGTFLSSLADLSDSIQTLWNTYVIGLNSDRQDRTIYQPLTDFGRAVQNLASDPKQTVGDLFTHLKQWLSGGGDGSESGLDWYVLAALVLLTIAAYIAYRLTRLIVRSGWRLLKRRRTRAAAQSRIEFYRRFEAILARHGLRRTANQTPLELAHRAAARLSGRRAAALPAHLVSAFYSVRYGGGQPNAAELAAIERELDLLREGLGKTLDGPQPSLKAKL
jgi:transglutaminase-like putative cysteine protease